MIDFDQKPEYLEWAAKDLGTNIHYFVLSRTIAFHANGLKAVAVYSRYDGNNCELSIAAKSPIWLRHLHIILAYPFRILGCQRVTILVHSRHQPMIKIALRLGFVLEGRMKRFFGEDDCLIFGLIEGCNVSYSIHQPEKIRPETAESAQPH